MLINGYSQHIAHKTLISQDQKNRIQELLSQMFNAITPRTEIDSPVYAWFPEGESTTEMEAISIDDSDPADRAVAQVMVEVNSNIELEAAPSLSAAPLRNFKSMVRELAGTSEEAEINRMRETFVSDLKTGTCSTSMMNGKRASKGRLALGCVFDCRLVSSRATRTDAAASLLGGFRR